MECGTKDLQRLPHGMVGRGLAVYRDRRLAPGNVTRVARFRPSPPKACRKKLERYAKAADIKASCHSLRHTFASNLLEAGAEVIAIKELLGHASIQSSERYAKLSHQRVKQAYQQAMQKVMAKTRV